MEGSVSCSLEKSFWYVAFEMIEMAAPVSTSMAKSCSRTLTSTVIGCDTLSLILNTGSSSSSSFCWSDPIQLVLPRGFLLGFGSFLLARQTQERCPFFSQLKHFDSVLEPTICWCMTTVSAAVANLHLFLFSCSVHWLNLCFSAF